MEADGEFNGVEIFLTLLQYNFKGWTGLGGDFKTNSPIHLKKENNERLANLYVDRPSWYI